jgi:hypothetical protein
VKLGEQRIRTCRRWNGQGPDRIGDFLSSRLVVNGEEIDIGEDPRPFVHQGRLSILTAAYSQPAGLQNFLVVLDERKQWKRYRLELPSGVYQGKNWSPFEFVDGCLGFVHTFSPLVVLREQARASAVIQLSAHEGQGFQSTEEHAGFSVYRGGTNGLSVGKVIVGLGHTTRKARSSDGAFVADRKNLYFEGHQVVHRPFGWVLDPKTLRMQELPVSARWDPQFWIIDPTSLLQHPTNGGCLELITTEVEKNFVDPSGQGRTVSYSVAFV